MTRNDPLATISARRGASTPQTERADVRQVKNHAGGFTFTLDDESRLRRFLILGTTGGTYYQGEHEITKENADLIVKMAADNPVRLVEILTEISVEGRAPKQNPVIFALAAAASSPVDAGRKAAFDAMPAVLRTASHLTLFASYLKQFRGWGSGLKRAGQRWYNGKSADQLAYQLTKYRSRNGFSQRDLLRVVHPRATDPGHQALYRWVAQGDVTDGLPRIVQGHLAAMEATTAKEWERLVRDYNLSWEMLPDAAMNEKAVWNALLDNGVPMTALIRQLSRLTNLGIIGSGLANGNRTADIVAQISNTEALQKARIHPLNVLNAQRTYAGGHSLRGSSSWTPVQAIVDALDKAFYKSFKNVEPANKSTMLALDVSSSMTWDTIAGTALSPRVASAAMALVTASTEPVYAIYGYTSSFSALAISPGMRLTEVIRVIDQTRMGGTDCALPFRKAREQGLAVETFVSYTDNETWAGYGHVHQELAKYRKASGIPARAVVVGMTATENTVLDPSDPGSLNVVGFDSAAPALIADFSAGRV